jgi:hypothetical protein
MPHSPPVPPGNQSPFPLRETPHDGAAGTEASASSAAPAAPASDEYEQQTLDSRARGTFSMVLAAGVLGALVAGAVILARRPAADAAAPKRKKKQSSKKH